MNKFLKTRQEIDDCTKYLQDNGLNESGLSCKNWDAANVLPYLRDGNILDMGSSGSIILENAVRKNLKGIKNGIDLAYKENYSENGVDYISGDLMDTPFPDETFDFVSCLSVVEHQVDFEKLAKECSRVMKSGAHLFISCDYWQPKPDTSKMKLYSLDWNILDHNDLVELIIKFAENGLAITSPIDWTLQDAVINDKYCSPAKDVSYTFFIGSFVKV